MPSKKRFRIGNMTVNLGKIDDALKYKPDPNCQRTYGCNQVTLVCNQFTWGGGGGCFPFTGGGGGCFPWTGGGGCGINYSTLPPTTPYFGGAIQTAKCNVSVGSITSPPNLSDIKESLINQLKEVEAYELEIKALETPQTLGEMDALESELENSLKELKKLKKNFRS